MMPAFALLAVSLLAATPAAPLPAAPVPPGPAPMSKAPPLGPPGERALGDAAVRARIKAAEERMAAHRQERAAQSHASRFTWDVPEKIEVVDVPGILRSDGIPLRLTAVRSKMKLEPLIRHFYGRFVEARLYVAEADEQLQLPKVPMLTALDTTTLISYTVVFQQNPDGTTTVVLGEAHLSERDPSPAGFDFAPIFPGASEVVRSDVEGMRTLTFTTGAKADEVLRFYRDVMGKAGSRELSPGLFQDGGRQVKVATHPLGGRLTVSISERAATAESDAAQP